MLFSLIFFFFQNLVLLPSSRIETKNPIKNEIVFVMLLKFHEIMFVSIFGQFQTSRQMMN